MPHANKKGITLVANCIVVCIHCIRCYGFLSAGAVVTKDVPEYALMIGVPARIAEWVCECGEKLHLSRDRASCKGFGKRYRLVDNEKLEQEAA